MSKNSLLNPTNVRLDSGALYRVKSLAKAHGIKASDLIRDAISAKLPEWETHGVKLTRLTGVAK